VERIPFTDSEVPISSVERKRRLERLTKSRPTETVDPSVTGPNVLPPTEKKVGPNTVKEDNNVTAPNEETDVFRTNPELWKNRPETIRFSTVTELVVSRTVLSVAVYKVDVTKE